MLSPALSITLWLRDRHNGLLRLLDRVLLRLPAHVRALDLAAESLDDDASDLVRVGVGRRAAVLEVALALLGAGTIDTDGGAAVGNAPGELVVSGGLVLAGHPEHVVLAVDLHVLDLARRQLLHGRLDVLHAAVRARLLGGDVCVQTGAVPVAWNGLGRKGHLRAKFLGNALQDESRHPELVAQADAQARADLVLPLGRHDFSVGARDLDASVQAGLVVRLDDVTAHDLAGADTAVVWALRSRETVLRPAVRPAISAEKSVLLLETEPILVLLVGLHHDGGVMAEVVGIRLAVPHPRLAHNKEVGLVTERAWKHGHWTQVDVGIVAGRLAGRGAVEVPFGKFIDVLDWLCDGLVPISKFSSRIVDAKMDEWTMVVS